MKIESKSSKLVLFLFKLFNWHMFFVKPRENENIVMVRGFRSYSVDSVRSRTHYTIETTATVFLFKQLWKFIKKKWPKVKVKHTGPSGMAPTTPYRKVYWLFGKDVMGEDW